MSYETTSRERLYRFAYGMKVLKAKEKQKALEQEAKDLQASFIDFFVAAWPVIDPAPFDLNRHHGAIAEHLEAVARGQIRKLLINVPPRHTKTLLVSVALPAWIWAQEPDPDFPLMGPQAKFLCLSYSDQLVMDNATTARRLIASDWYQARWGHRVKITSDQDAKNKFDTSAGGTRISASFGGTVTGRGAEWKLIDDPHKIDEAESEVVRDGIIRQYDGTLKSRVTDPRIAAEIIVMQRVHENDLAGHVLDTDDDFVHLNLPAEYDARRHCTTVLGWEDWRTEDGELLWPDRFGADELVQFKRNPYEWSGQWQQLPVPRGGSILKADWWQIWDKFEAEKYGLEWNDERGKLKQMPPCEFVIASLDTAYDTKKENDYSALTIWGSFTTPVGDQVGFDALLDANGQRISVDSSGIAGHRRWMCLYAWQARLEFHDLVERVSRDCKKYSVSRLLVEAAASGKSVVQELRRAYARESFGVTEINPGRLDKTARAHSIVYCFTDKMVWIPDPEVLDWANMVVDECAKFPKGTHDDLVDSVTQALGWLRLYGLAERRDEHEAEVADSLRYKKRNKEALYPGT